jgi:O-antigen ligase
VLGALVASTVAGLAFGYWRIWSGAGKSGTLQLHSVGHVNHTAIYLAIMLGVCTAWIFARWRAWRAGRKAVAAAVAILVLGSLLMTASRGAVAAALAAVLLLALLWWPRWRTPFVVSLAGAGVVVAAMVGFGSELIRKHETWAAKDNMLSSRDAIWRMGLAAWQRYPWFGVGMDNYSLISHESVRAWRSEAGEDYDEQRYLPNAHAHSLYVNTLAERGVVGALALAAVLVTWLAWLLRYRPRPGDGDEAWRLWGGSAAAWWVTVSMGAVNTTLHHEHGILAALLLGMWLSWLARRRAS